MFSGGLREVVIAFIVLAAGLTAGIGIRTGGLDPVDVFLQVVVPCAASFAMGLWIDRIIRQSEDRAELLRTLRRTQDELARAHHLAGAAAERERVARDIHDTLAQGFTSIVLLSEAGLDQVRRPAEAEATLRAIRRVAHDNLGEARALVQSGQQRWDDSAFLGALERTCARAQTVSPGRMEVRAVIDQSATGLDVNEKIMVLRGLQEALANVLKHAEAASVTVTFTADEDTARLSVSDDGIGFDPAADRGATDGHGHFGLPSMRQRAAEIGADLAIASRPGQGTRLDITVARTGSEDGHA
jgi:signal transduction histidine kinase